MSLNVTDAIKLIRQEQEGKRRRHIACAASRENSSSKSKSSSVKVPRVRRAPASASQYHFSLKYSNRAGAHKSPLSSTGKLLYDFGLDRSDDERVVFIHISAPPNLPSQALDIRAIGAEAERSAGRQSNSRQMAHFDVALPRQLSVEGRNKLVVDLADDVRHRMGDAVPVFAAVHVADDANQNGHAHMSYPIRLIHAIGNCGDFVMRDRIMFEQRPLVRKAAGLKPTNHQDLRDWRYSVAQKIADAVLYETGDYELAERWRAGHLPLQKQVQAAAVRGDVQFVLENASRDPTLKEGYNRSRWRNKATDLGGRQLQPHSTGFFETDQVIVPPKLLTQTAVAEVMRQAKGQGIAKPAHLQLFAKNCGLEIIWKKSRTSGAVRGVCFALTDGPKFSGKSIGFSFHQLKSFFGWTGVLSHVEIFSKYEGQIYAAGKISRYTQIDALHVGFAKILRRAEHLVEYARQVESTDHFSEQVAIQNDVKVLLGHKAAESNGFTQEEQHLISAFQSLVHRYSECPKGSEAASLLGHEMIQEASKNPQLMAVYKKLFDCRARVERAGDINADYEELIKSKRQRYRPG